MIIFKPLNALSLWIESLKIYHCSARLQFSSWNAWYGCSFWIM